VFLVRYLTRAICRRQPLLSTNNYYHAFFALLLWPQNTRSVLFTCCNEGPTAVNCGTPQYKPSAGQPVSPGAVGRFPSSRSNTRASGGPRSGMTPGLPGW
jgi:hypothetical protein